MPTKDTTKLKEKIISIFKKRGPSLPVHIAKETGLSMLFSSVFLSELLSEKKLRISNLRVGSSPVYFIPGQEPMLKKFSHHLKSKEKDAYLLLKREKFLKDSEQLPAIRVALRAIKDFAIPLKEENEISWRYFTSQKPKFQNTKFLRENKQIQEIKKIQQSEIPPPTIQEIKTPIEKNSNLEKIDEGKKVLDIFDKPKQEKILQKNIESKTKEENSQQKTTTKIKTPETKKRLAKKKTTKKQNDKFFNKVKEFLSRKSIEISDIEGFSKNDLTLKVKTKDKEYLLVAYNKKRINEKDITKAYKKASELKLPYLIISMGEPLKKLSNLIEAIKNLKGIEKMME